MSIAASPATREGRAGAVIRLAQAGRMLRAWALRPAYGLYTKRLREEVAGRDLPRHVAVILDGNRRWANATGLAEAAAGHRAGADKLDELIDWCVRLQLERVTIWALSGENLARPSEQLEGLFDVVADKLNALATLHRGQSLQIRVVGRHGDLPARLRMAIEAVETATAANSGLLLTIAVGYSGRDELVDAARSLVRRLIDEDTPPARIADLITREELARHLYTAGEPDPDLIIRTSGEIRLSGFLPWQGAHSELYFTDVYWPAFRELDFLRALRSFQQRQRRFGR